MRRKVDWNKILTRRITPQILPIVSSPKYYFFKYLGAGFKNQLYVPVDKKHEFHFSGVEWTQFEEAVIRRINEVPNFLFEHAKDCFRVCDEITSLTKDMEQTSDKDNAKLKVLYTRYLNKFEEYYIFLWTPHIIENFLENATKTKLKEHLLSEGRAELFDEYLTCIFTKTKLNDAEKEEIELLEISRNVKQRGTEIDPEVDILTDEHTRKWAWLPFYSLDMQPWSEKYFAERIRKFENPEEELSRREKDSRRRNENLEKVRLALRTNRELLALIDVVQDYLYLRTYRTDTLRKMLYNMRPFLSEVAKRAKLTYDQIIYMTPNEILCFLDKGDLPSVDELKSRREGFLIITRNDEDIKVFSRKETIAKITRLELGERIVEKKLVVEGVGVYPGIVTGRAKIIDSIEEGDKMKKGDILVTTMTTPEMVEIYHKAAAIVTDEGGLTCHGAIVSRELEIPAVISTGEATSVFRDGMLITVNSIKGLVSRVEPHGGKD